MEIVIENVSKSIHGVEVLKDINVKFEGGKIYGLRGKNGSGKTMIMRMISGLIRPSSGRVIIDGKMLGRDMSFPESIGVLIENPSLYKSVIKICNIFLSILDTGYSISP